MSLIKNFDKLEILSQAGVLASMVGTTREHHQHAPSFGLTPLIGDMERLQVVTAKRKSKDDFDVSARSSKVEVSANPVKEHQNVTVVKQLKDIFNTDMNELNHLLPCKCCSFDLPLQIPSMVRH